MPTVAVPAPLTTLDTLLAATRARRLRGERAAIGRVGAVLAGIYELEEHVAEGGMANVFRAYDRRLGREVAVKIPRLERAAPAHMLALFWREVRATARLHHPGVIALHEVREHEGVPFAVLELLHGETLAQRLAGRGALPWPAAAEILAAVLEALEHVHARGVLHRDLTPSNVFLPRAGGVKLLDFGVALSSSEPAGASALGAGTPGYLPPEHGRLASPRGDLWMAAFVFLESVTGARPATDAPLGSLPPQVPASLGAVLARALHPDPQRRPATAAALRSALVGAIAGAARAASAHRVSAPRRPPLRAAIAAALLALAAAVAVSAGGVSARHAPRRAAPPREHAAQPELPSAPGRDGREVSSAPR